MSKIASEIYELVKKIPAGKVSTYGQIAKLVGTSPRVVGNALHKNPRPDLIPCHRVVNCKGEVATNFAFGGGKIHMERLAKEGIIFSKNKIDLAVYGCPEEFLLLLD